VCDNILQEAILPNQLKVYIQIEGEKKTNSKKHSEMFKLTTGKELIWW